MTNNFNTIEGIIGAIQNPEYYVNRQSGIWQATKEYEKYTMRVIRDVNLVMDIPFSREELQLVTNADQPWSDLHFNERVSGEPLNPGESYRIWPYNKFQDNDDPYMTGKQKFSHTYMERFWPCVAGDEFERREEGMGIRDNENIGIRYEYGDLSDVMEQLANNTLTRQAYLPIFFPEDTGAVHKQRVPCTLGYLFEIWEDRLDVTYYIRSCDTFRHLRNDIYLAGLLVQYITDRINLNTNKYSPGKLTMKIANLHLFENDLYAFQKKERKLNINGK